MDPPQDFDFPFPPYQIQKNFMKNLYEVIEKKQLGIFESPTGTGKSLSIVCGALRWLKDHNENKAKELDSIIKKLETKIKALQSISTDWLSAQSEAINDTRELNQFKLEQKKMFDYEEKIKNISKSVKGKKNKSWRQHVKIESNAQLVKEGDKVNENLEDDDDLVLEDIALDDEESSDEDETEEYKPTKILICSRTHSQLSQLVGEILKSPFNETRTASLASRNIYCINPVIKSLKSVSLINDRCLDMQRKSSKATSINEGKTVKKMKVHSGSCPYYKQQNIEELANITLTEVCDVEDLIKISKEIKGCPYYSSRKAAEDAQIVLIPYNTLLHKTTREASGISIKNNVIIIDEAHNLLEALAQMYSSEVYLEQLKQSKISLSCYKEKYSTRFSARNLLCINQLLFILGKLVQVLSSMKKENETEEKVFTVSNFVLTAEIDNYNIHKLVKFCKESKIAHKVNSFIKKFGDEIENFGKVKTSSRSAVQNFLSTIDSKSKKQIEVVEVQKEKSTFTGFGNPFLSFLSFLETLTNAYEDGRVIVRKTADDKRRKLQFLLLNPSSQFSEIVKEARSVIVAGGTMKPISEFRDRLFKSAGADPLRIKEFSCDHIIPDKNILPIIVTKGPKGEPLLFNFEKRFITGKCLKDILLDVTANIKGGIVVFFPSYKYESWIWQQLQGIKFKLQVFREPQDSASVESVLNGYAGAIKKKGGAILFSVVGGKLSEGLNFSDDLGRCVIVVGLPYANIQSAELKEKMKYLDMNEKQGAGQEFYEALCMKSVNQCIGRAVRHQNDYACVLLLDERYNRTNTKNALPEWIQRSLITSSYQEASTHMIQFFEDRKMDSK